jgi:hypothetical protein
MSSKSYASSLWVEVGRSRWLMIVLTVIHALSGVALLRLDLDWRLTAALGAGLVLSLGHTLRRHGLGRGRRAVRRIQVDPAGRIRVETGDGRRREVSLRPGSVVTPWLVLLDLTDTSGGRLGAVLSPDAVDADRLRALRSRLRIRQGR